MISSPAKNQSQLDPYDSDYDPQSAGEYPEEPGWEEEFDTSDAELGMESEEGESEFNIEEDFGSGEDTFGEGESDQPLTAKQERLVRWMEEHNPKILEKSEEVRNRLEEIQGGYLEGTLEEQEKKIKESLDLLEEIETELLLYKAKENQLEKTGMKEEDLLGDQAISKEFEAELEKFEEGIRKAGSENSNAQSKEEMAEIQKTMDETKGKQLKDRVLDALGHLTKAKKPLYFTAEKVWNVDTKSRPYIRKYSGDDAANQTYAQELMSDFAAAFESGDWEIRVKSSLGSLPSSNAAHTLNLVYAVLSREAPGILEEMPSEILQLMSDKMRAGSGAGENPKKTGVFYDEKANYMPTSHRIRYGLEEFGKKAIDSADVLTAMAESNKQKEEANAALNAANEPPPQPFDEGYVDPAEDEGYSEETEAADEAPSETESAVDEAVE